jgi:putative transposase
VVQQYRPGPKGDVALVGRLKEPARRIAGTATSGYLRCSGWRVGCEPQANLPPLHRGRSEGAEEELPRRDRIARQARPMQRWSLDFVSDRLDHCRRFRVLNIIAASARARSPTSRSPVRGPPAISEWSERLGVRLRFIEPGKPVQNAFVESLNGRQAARQSRRT